MTKKEINTLKEVLNYADSMFSGDAEEILDENGIFGDLFAEFANLEQEISNLIEDTDL